MGRKQSKKALRVKNLDEKNLYHMWKFYESVKSSRKIDDVNKRLECIMYGHPTLLHLSIYKDDEEFMDYLLSIEGIDVNIPTEEWGLALDLAVKRKKLPVVQKLLEAGTDVKLLVRKPQLKRSSLHNAIFEYEFSEEIVNLVINHGASVDNTCIHVNGDDPFTPIEVAVRFNIKVLEFLLNHCVNFHRPFKLLNDYVPFLTYGLKITSMHKNQLIKKIFEFVFRRFIIIYYSANFYVGEFHLNAVQFDKKLDILRIQCQIEVEMMKRLFVDNTKISYYYLLHKSPQQLAFKLIHIDIDKKAMIATAEKLKNYMKMMTYKINKVLYRVEMIKKYRPLVAKYFHVLPIEFIDAWVHYLNIPDMVNIAIALKKRK